MLTHLDLLRHAKEGRWVCGTPVHDRAFSCFQVQHIIVCAHYDCSGVTASMEKLDLTSPLDEWVRNIRDVYRCETPSCEVSGGH